MCIGYIGKSSVSDTEIRIYGTATSSRLMLMVLADRLTETHPIYHGLTNNCQNFVVYLLRYICPQSTALPSTIQQAIYCLRDPSSFNGRPMQVLFVSSTWPSLIEDPQVYTRLKGIHSAMTTWLNYV